MILGAIINIKVELNIKGHDYYKFITNDMNNKKYKIVLEARSKIFASFLCDDLDKNIITNILDVAICHNLSRVI